MIYDLTKRTIITNCLEEYDWDKQLTKDLDILKNAANNWIPCNEKLPEHGQLCLVQLKFTNEIFIGYMEDDDEWRSKTYKPISLNNTIVWQPLPKEYDEEELKLND